MGRKARADGRCWCQRAVKVHAMTLVLKGTRRMKRLQTDMSRALALIAEGVQSTVLEVFDVVRVSVFQSCASFFALLGRS
jgi:hypothetical protein